ncbi:MAG TPA: toll/interleukin-1 receptor domain-containing protein [Polyangiaceae bacterium]|nr:toll/interleukin-1 receptor domain-containing protein [Polyangiaceae bacterium]
MNVFVSHSRSNASVALALRERLKSPDLNLWVDVMDTPPGADFRKEVTDALERADGLIVLVGPESSPDEWQRADWQQIVEHEYYLDPDKAIIPVVLGSAELPGFLRTRHAIAIDPSSPDLNALVGAIQTALQKPSETVDREKLERGRAARQVALDRLKEYSRELEQAEVKLAPIRGLK